jgi:hypothetical protein
LRILIDESLPVAFASEVLNHDVSTVRAEKWLGFSNGSLLRAAVRRGFDVIITADSAIRHQQNLVAIGIAAVLLTHVRNRLVDLRPLLPKIDEALANIRTGEIIEIHP